MARIGAMWLAVVLLAVGFFSPQTPLRFFVAVGAALMSQVAAGWAPQLPRGARVWFLFAPLALAIAVTLCSFTFMAAALIAAMSLVLVWATMLGPWWVGLVTLGWFMGALIVAGYLHVMRFVAPDPSITSMALAKNWTRVAFSLSAVQAGMLASITITVRRAGQAIATMIEANQRVQHTREEEDAEGMRALMMEREATRIERMSVSGMAAGAIAHDVNNALQALAMASLLDNPALSHDEVRSIAHELRQSARYCAALVGLVAQDPQEVVAERSALDVSAALGRLTNLLPAFVSDQVSTHIEIEPECWAVLSERDLQRIVLNLAINAQDAMSDGGALQIALLREGDQLLLRVRDSGTGMDEVTRSRVFEPFFTTKPAGKGTGLGLHAVSRIVAETAGTLACDSRLDVGTTFSIRWPCAPPEPKHEPDHAASDVIGASGPVLVAEDQTLVRQVIVRALRAIGCNVREACDGDAALALIESDVEWTALCIDGVMPGRPTSEVIDAFIARHPQCPVLLCSGHLPRELVRRGVRADKVTVVSKPFSPHELQRALLDALDECRSA